MQPMKITAIAVVVIGLLIAGFAGMSLIPGETKIAGPESSDLKPFPIAAVLFPFSILAIGAGVAMWFYGGRGAVKTRDPAVRN